MHTVRGAYPPTIIAQKFAVVKGFFSPKAGKSGIFSFSWMKFCNFPGVRGILYGLSRFDFLPGRKHTGLFSVWPDSRTGEKIREGSQKFEKNL